MTTDTSKTTFAISGTLIGGLYDHQIGAGSNREVQHSPLKQLDVQYAPGRRDESLLTLQAYTNASDPGQSLLMAADRNRSTFVLTINHADGRVETALAFVLNITERGGKQNGQAIGRSTIQIRMTGGRSLS